MRIVLTGARGFIGSRLRERLTGDGHQVIPVSHQNWDISASQFPRHVMEEAEAVVHLAGEPVAQRWTSDAKLRIRMSRSEGTARVVEAIRGAGRPPRVLVCASAIGYYGDRGEELLTEESARGSDFLAGVCAEWEAAAARAREAGCRVVMVRTGIALGLGGGALQQMLTPFRLGLGGRLGSGRQWMSWIHVDDLVSIFARAVKDPALSGPVNGVAPEPVRNQEFTQILAGAMHRPAVLPAPAFALRLAFGEMASMLLGSQRVAPRALERAGFEFRHPKLDGTLEALFRNWH